MCGLYEMFQPALVIGDPDLLKHILVKDFDHFSDRRIFTAGNNKDVISNSMLTNMNGEKWKATRAIMTPTFTSGKMRGMFHLVCEKADDLVSFCLTDAAQNSSVDMKHNYGRYTIDTIASCAFGLECNSLVNEDAIFPKKAAVFFEMRLKSLIRFFFLFALPSLFKTFKIRLNPPEFDFFKEVVQEAVAARNRGLKRGDFLDLLLESREQHGSGDGASKQVMDENNILAQSILFIIVGYDTTASTLAFASHLLSKYPETQQRLRQEMQDMVKENGSVTYQGIMEAKYLDACLMETLRLFPPIPIGERVCTKPYTLPGTDVTLEPGTIVQFPIWSLHHDAKYWPEPEVFKPERFLPENKADIKGFTHVPFGMGPRNCIAMRFALMEAKVALAKMVLAVEMKLKPGHEELKLINGPGILRPGKDLQLILTPLRGK